MLSASRIYSIHTIPRAMLLCHHHLSFGSCHHLLPALSVLFLAWLQFVPHIAAKGRFKKCISDHVICLLRVLIWLPLILKIQIPYQGPKTLPPSSPTIKQCSSHTGLFFSWNILFLRFLYLIFSAWNPLPFLFFMVGFFWIFRAQHKCYFIQEGLSDHLILSGLVAPGYLLSFSCP